MKLLKRLPARSSQSIRNLSTKPKVQRLKYIQQSKKLVKRLPARIIIGRKQSSIRIIKAQPIISRTASSIGSTRADQNRLWTSCKSASSRILGRTICVRCTVWCTCHNHTTRDCRWERIERRCRCWWSWINRDTTYDSAASACSICVTSLINLFKNKFQWNDGIIVLKCYITW